MLRVIAVLLVSLCHLAIESVEGSETSSRTIRGFADLNFEIDDDDSSNSRFRIGEYDTYITGTLAPGTSFLSEVTYEYREEWIISLRRLWVRYTFNDYLRVSVGKFHTPLGYWNRAFHHGVLLYTSVDKPFFQEMIPIHTLGVYVTGREIGSGRFYYGLMIGNGIGSSPVEDNDDTKSVIFDIHSKAVDGFDFGFSYYRDRASKEGMDESGTPHLAHFDSLAEDVDMSVLVASCVIEKRGAELLAELAFANNDGKSSGNNWSKGGYLLGSYALGQYVPFARLDFIDIEDDPFFEPLDTRAISLGLNYRLSHLAVVKTQYRYQSVDGADNSNRFSTQLAIGF